MKKKPNWLKTVCAVCLLCALSAAPAIAQGFETLVDFNLSNGASPAFAALVQGVDGDFYGTTANASSGPGTVFKVTPLGVVTTLYSFAPSSGASTGGLTLGSDGDFYGITGGGTHGDGTIFKITPQGTLTTLLDFNGADGVSPTGLILGTDGSLSWP